MSSMIGRIVNGRRINQFGGINVLLFPLILSVLILFGTAGFGIWAYSQYQDYKTNTDQKIASSVEVAKQEESVQKDKEHAEADKSPLRTYSGPEQFGALKVAYPKTWSGYVIDSGNSSQPLDGFFQPGVVPSTADQTATYALRVQVLNQTYSDSIKAMQDQSAAGTVTAVPYAFPKVTGTVGTRFDGAILSGKKITGSMVVMPLRDKTIMIWTESQLFVADFNTYILPNITFSP